MLHISDSLNVVDSGQRRLVTTRVLSIVIFFFSISIVFSTSDADSSLIFRYRLRIYQLSLIPKSNSNVLTSLSPFKRDGLYR